MIKAPDRIYKAVDGRLIRIYISPETKKVVDTSTFYTALLGITVFELEKIAIFNNWRLINE